MAPLDDGRDDDALSRLLIDLSARGVKVTPDQHFRALSVYLALKASSEPRPNARVATLIGPLVCRSVEDQRIFAGIVPLWFPPETSAEPGTGPAASAAVAVITHERNDAVREAERAAGRVRIRSLIVPLAVSLFVCACLVFSFRSISQIHPAQQPANLPALITISGGRGVGGRSDVGNAGTGAPTSSGGASQTLSSPPAQTDPVAQTGPFWWQLLALAAPIGALIGVISLARLAFAQLARMMRVLPDKDMSRLLLEAPNALHAGPDFYRLVQPLRTKIAVAAAELDIDATIDATVRGGGLSTLVYKQRRVAPEYVVLVDKRCPEDHAARFCELLCAALDQAGVALQQYTFNADPRRVVPKRGGRAVDLREVSGSSHLIVFSDGFGLANEQETAPDELGLVLANYSRRLLFTWRDPADWNRREWLLEEQLLFSVFSATEAGLAQAAQLLVGEGTREKLDASYAHRLGARDERLDGLLSVPTRWLDTAGPGPAGTAELLRRLKRELDAGTYGLLTALAVYPALTWTTSVFVGKHVVGYDALKRGLSRLAGLPWLRVGRMPIWLREALVRDMPAGVRAQVRSALAVLLSTATGSGAKDAAIEFALGSPARDHIERSGASRDAIVIDVMTRVPGNVTDLPIPAALSRALGLSILSKARRAAFPLGHPSRLAPVFLLLAGGTAIMVTVSIAAFVFLANRTVVTQVVRAELHARLRSAAFSANGRCITAIPANDDFIVWDAASGRRLAEFRNASRLDEARFSEKGFRDMLLTLQTVSGIGMGHSAAGRLALPDPQNVFALYDDYRRRSQPSLTSPDGRFRLVVKPGLLLVSGERMKTAVAIPLAAELSDAEFSPDGSKIAVALADHKIYLWDPATGVSGAVLTGHEGTISSAVFSPDGRRIISMSSDRTVRVWDIGRRAALAILPAKDQPEQEVYAAALAADGSRIVTLSDTGTERIWRIESVAATVVDLARDKLAGWDGLSSWRSPPPRRPEDLSQCLPAATNATVAVHSADAPTPVVFGGPARGRPTPAPSARSTDPGHRRNASASARPSPAIRPVAGRTGNKKPAWASNENRTVVGSAVKTTRAASGGPSATTSRSARLPVALSTAAAQLSQQIDLILRDVATDNSPPAQRVAPTNGSNAPAAATIAATPTAVPIGVVPPALQTPTTVASGAPESPGAATPTGSADPLEAHLSMAVKTADALSVRGQNARAALEYREVIRQNPSYVAAHVGLGDALAVEGNFDEALVQYREALQLDSKSVGAHEGLGVTLYDLGRFSEAISEFTAAISLSPTRPDLFIDRGKAHYRLGDFTAAIEDDTAALSIKPSLTQAYVDRGFAIVALGNTSGAMMDFNRAIAADDKNARAYSARGALHYRLGQYHSALSDLTHALMLDPGNLRTLLTLQAVRLQMKDGPGAAADRQRIEELTGINVKAKSTPESRPTPYR